MNGSVHFTSNFVESGKGDYGRDKFGLDRKYCVRTNLRDFDEETMSWQSQLARENYKNSKSSYRVATTLLEILEKMKNERIIFCK